MMNLSSYKQYYYADSCILIPDALKLGLVSYWNFDEATGTRADSHGSVELLENGVPIGIDSDPIFGDVIDFAGGGSSNLYITYSSALEIPYASAFSVAGWVNFDSVDTGSNQYIVDRADNGANANNEIDWGIWLNDTSNALSMRGVSSSTAYDATWGSVLSAATWYFIYGYYDPLSDVLGISLDLGTPVTTAMSASLNTGGDQFKFGRLSFDASWAAYLDGKATRWGLWSRLLSTKELAYLYNDGRGRLYAEITP